MIVGTQFQLLELAMQQVPVVHGSFLHLAREWQLNLFKISGLIWSTQWFQSHNVPISIHDWWDLDDRCSFPFKRYKMPIICEHPNWWVVSLLMASVVMLMSLSEALKVFHEHKIFVVKEEGDTSAVNQPYDQSVAKAEKANIRDLLDQIRFKLGVIDQWDLIGICCNALKKVGKDAWISSFKRSIFTQTTG